MINLLNAARFGVELGHPRYLQKEFDVAAEAIAIEKIERAIAEDLVGHIGVADGDVACVGRIHCRRQSVSPPQLCHRKPVPPCVAGAYRPEPLWFPKTIPEGVTTFWPRASWSPSPADLPVR
jgi:hypothetical protein